MLEPGTTEYVRLHKEIIATYGSAKLWDCVICGGTARDWAHRHNTDQMNVANYDAMCKSCHIRYDCTEDTRAKHRLKMLGNTNLLGKSTKCAEGCNCKRHRSRV